MIISSFLMMNSFEFASIIPEFHFEIRSKKLHDFIVIFFVYFSELIPSVIILISVKGPGPTIHHISFISYRSTRSTSFFGNVMEVSRLLSSLSMIVFLF